MPSQSVTDPPQVDPGFHRHIIPPADEERRLLEENLLRDGCRDPLVVWAETGLLLDGHNRLAICQQHGLNYQVESINLPDREAALDWIDTNQAGRRNMRPDDLKIVIGRIYNRRKISPTESALRAVAVREARRAAGQNAETWKSENPTSMTDTGKEVGEQFGVGRDAVISAGKLAAEYDAIRAENPEASHRESLAVAKAVARSKTKAPDQAPRERAPADERAASIGVLVSKGHSSRQIAGVLGISDQQVRNIANRAGIELDPGFARTKQTIDPVRVVTETVNVIEGAATGLAATNADASTVPPTEAAGLAVRLTEALRPINGLLRQLREVAAA